MAYFTDDKDVATNYSNSKEDTSLVGELSDPKDRFVLKSGDNETKAYGVFWLLPAAKREEITRRAGEITFDDDTGETVRVPGNKSGTGGFDMHLRQFKGNAIKALYEEWINSGNLMFEDEKKFVDVLKLAGVDNVVYKDPYFADPGVYDVFMDMKRPLDTSKIPEELISQLEDAAKKAEKRFDMANAYGADAWAKDAKSPLKWIEDLRDDIKDNTTYTWTTIPDFVTKVLKKNGYDGVADTGGKYSGTQHNVYIPFKSTQVKSASENVGTYKKSDKDIRFSRKAPNGKKSHLTDEQWEQVRTPEFKAWFGDWENDPANASKVVDENGEPLVVYHGSGKKFTEFLNDKFRSGASKKNKNKQSYYGDGFYFATDYYTAATYGRNVMEVFLNIRNPSDGDLNTSGSDGAVGYSMSGKMWVAREPNQIKSATDNNGNFDPKNNDIRFSKKGRVFERDELGNLRFKPGRIAVEKFGAFAVPALDAFTGAKAKITPASKELRMQLREMAAAIDNAGRKSLDLAKAMQGISEAERKMVSDVVEKELASGVVPPKHVMDIATQMSDAMDKQTDELVSLGMLSKESADRWRGKYLPRFYMRPDLFKQAKDAKNFFSGIFKSSARGVSGSHLKGRGMFDSVPFSQVNNFLALGWEVRDPAFKVVNGKVQAVDPSIVPNPSEEVNIWRDYSKNERAQMGEVRDASFRFAIGYMDMQRDIAVGRLFNAIANNSEWSRSSPAEGYVQVPDTTISETGGVKRYGNLAGKYVKETVWAHIEHINEVQDGFGKAYKTAMAFWKEGKTAINPVSHVNNVMGNLIMSHIAGVDMWDVKTYGNAFKEMYKDGALFKEAQDAGLFTGSFSRSELIESLPEPFKNVLKQDEDPFKKFGDMSMKILTWGLRNKLRTAYEAEDSIFKMAIYLKSRKAGLKPSEAVDYAHQHIFVYDNLPNGARLIRDSVLPFFAWSYQALPKLVTTMVQYPHRFFLPTALLYTANALSYLCAAGDDDDDWGERIKKAFELEKAERQLLPDYMKGNTFFFGTPKALRLGINEATGMPRYLNMANMIPGGNFFDTENQSGGLPIPEYFMPSHPVTSAMTYLIFNRDPFTGRDPVRGVDTTAEKIQTWAKYAYTQIVPAIAAESYHWSRMMQGIAGATGTRIPSLFGEYTGVNRRGEAMELTNAVINTFGVKIRDIDVDLEAQRKINGVTRNVDDLKHGERSLFQNVTAR